MPGSPSPSGADSSPRVRWVTSTAKPPVRAVISVTCEGGNVDGVNVFDDSTALSILEVCVRRVGRLQCVTDCSLRGCDVLPMFVEGVELVRVVAASARPCDGVCGLDHMQGLRISSDDNCLAEVGGNIGESLPLSHYLTLSLSLTFTLTLSHSFSHSHSLTLSLSHS